MNRFTPDVQPQKTSFGIYDIEPSIAESYSSSVALNEENYAELCEFLASVANTTLKVKILQLFLTHSRLYLSSPALAARLDSPIVPTREALQQLDKAGVLNYCPHFAFADMCTLSVPQLPQALQLKLGILLKALRFQSDLVWNAVKNNEEIGDSTSADLSAGKVYGQVGPVDLPPGASGA